MAYEEPRNTTTTSREYILSAVNKNKVGTIDIK